MNLPSARFDVDFNPQRAQPHEIVNDLAGVRTVIEQARLQHHLLGIKPEAFVRAGIIIMPANRVLVFPGKTKLKIMARDSFVDADWPGIHRSCPPEIAEFVRRFGHVADAILVQTRWRSEIVGLAKAECLQIIRCRAQRPMLDPVRNAHDPVVFEKFSNLKFFCGSVLDPTIDVVRHFQRRHILVAVLFVNLERNCPGPFLPAHGQKFLGRIRHQCHVAQKPNVIIATERRLLRQRRQLFLKIGSEFFERVGGTIDRAVQFGFVQGGRRSQRCAIL